MVYLPSVPAHEDDFVKGIYMLVGRCHNSSTVTTKIWKFKKKFSRPTWRSIFLLGLSFSCNETILKFPKLKTSSRPQNVDKTCKERNAFFFLLVWNHKQDNQNTNPKSKSEMCVTCILETITFVSFFRPFLPNFEWLKTILEEVKPMSMTPHVSSSLYPFMLLTLVYF